MIWVKNLLLKHKLNILIQFYDPCYLEKKRSAFLALH